MSKENKVDDLLIKEEVGVEIGDETVVLTEMPRKKYKKMMGLIAGVVDEISNGSNFDLDNIEENLEQLFLYLSDDVLLELYEIATDLDKEFLDQNLTMSQEIELFTAICQVNRLEKIVKNFMTLTKLTKPVVGTVKKYLKR